MGRKDDDFDLPLPTPEYWMSEEEVEAGEFYSVRGPDDWVVSGPLGNGRGRCFPDWESAERWVRGFYGRRFRGPVAELLERGNRWAFWIRGKK